MMSHLTSHYLIISGTGLFHVACRRLLLYLFVSMYVCMCGRIYGFVCVSVYMFVCEYECLCTWVEARRKNGVFLLSLFAYTFEAGLSAPFGAEVAGV